MVSVVVDFRGDDAELPVEKTVPLTGMASTGALDPLAAILAITPPVSPWWAEAEYFKGVIAGSA